MYFSQYLQPVNGTAYTRNSSTEIFSWKYDVYPPIERFSMEILSIIPRKWNIYSADFFFHSTPPKHPFYCLFYSEYLFDLFSRRFVKSLCIPPKFQYSLKWRLNSWPQCCLILVWIWRCIQVFIFPEIIIKIKFVSVLATTIHVLPLPIFIRVKLFKMCVPNFIRILQIIWIVFDISVIRLRLIILNRNITTPHPHLTINNYYTIILIRDTGTGCLFAKKLQLHRPVVWNECLGRIITPRNLWLIISGFWSRTRWRVNRCVSVDLTILTQIILYNLSCYISMMDCLLQVHLLKQLRIFLQAPFYIKVIWYFCCNMIFCQSSK